MKKYIKSGWKRDYEANQNINATFGMLKYNRDEIFEYLDDLVQRGKARFENLVNSVRSHFNMAREDARFFTKTWLSNTRYRNNVVMASKNFSKPNRYISSAGRYYIRNSRSSIKSARILYPFMMCGRFEDNFEICVGGLDEEDCMARLIDLIPKHGELIWYSGVNDEDYADGVINGLKNNFIYESRRINASEYPTHDSDGRSYPHGYWDEYFGKTSADKWGDIISDELRGKKISKRSDWGYRPGGLEYEADQLGMDDLYELLEALEGMCYEGRVREIDDSTYLVL